MYCLTVLVRKYLQQEQVELFYIYHWRNADLQLFLTRSKWKFTPNGGSSAATTFGVNLHVYLQRVCFVNFHSTYISIALYIACSFRFDLKQIHVTIRLIKRKLVKHARIMITILATLSPKLKFRPSSLQSIFRSPLQIPDLPAKNTGIISNQNFPAGCP